MAVNTEIEPGPGPATTLAAVMPATAMLTTPMATPAGPTARIRGAPLPHHSLLHDPQYHAQVAGRNAGYNQPPHPSFYPGEGMNPHVQQPIPVP